MSDVKFEEVFSVPAAEEFIKEIRRREVSAAEYYEAKSELLAFLAVLVYVTVICGVTGHAVTQSLRGVSLGVAVGMLFSLVLYRRCVKSSRESRRERLREMELLAKLEYKDSTKDRDKNEHDES